MWDEQPITGDELLSVGRVDVSEVCACDVCMLTNTAHGRVVFCFLQESQPQTSPLRSMLDMYVVMQVVARNRSGVYLVVPLRGPERNDKRGSITVSVRSKYVAPLYVSAGCNGPFVVHPLSSTSMHNCAHATFD